MTVESSDSAARTTLALLQLRLRRLEFLVGGALNDEALAGENGRPTDGPATPLDRLNALEHEVFRLGKLTGPSGRAVRELSQLSSTHPDVFSGLSHAEVSHQSEDLGSLASIVLSHAALFPETASRLSSLQSLPIPPADQSSALVELVPRLRRCQQQQEEMDDQLGQLRAQSARMLEWWVKVGVIGMGELWEDWERRIAEIEKRVRRRERMDDDDAIS